MPDRRSAEGVLREKEKNLKKHLTFMPDSRKRKCKAAGHRASLCCAPVRYGFIRPAQAGWNRYAC